MALWEWFAYGIWVALRVGGGRHDDKTLRREREALRERSTFVTFDIDKFDTQRSMPCLVAYRHLSFLRFCR